MSIVLSFQQLREEIPTHVKIVAVSKLKPEGDIFELYNAGHLDFGENYVQEMISKSEHLPHDIRWHFIGHLQSNKVKYIAPFVHLIHSVDSLKLLKEINKQAAKCQRVISCLFQIHIATEDTKTGLSKEEFFEIVNSEILGKLKNVHVIGLMGMSTFTHNTEVVRSEFKNLKQLYDQAKKLLPQLTEISMGMSGDWPIAVQEGSTMVRLGSSIFGERI